MMDLDLLLSNVKHFLLIYFLALAKKRLAAEDILQYL